MAGSTKNLGSAILKFLGDDKGLQNTLKNVTQKVGAGMKQVGIAATAAGAAITGVLGGLAKTSAEIDQALSKVATLGVKNLDKIRENAHSLAKTFGTDVVDNINQFYTAISKGIPEDSAFLVLEAASKGAVAGAGELSGALELGTSLMNAYGLVTGDASTNTANMELVMGKAATAIKYGATTINELGASVGKASSLFEGAGVSMDEFLASISAVTKGGLQTSEAVSGLKQVVSNILKPTSAAAKAAEKLGIEFNASALSAKGFEKFLADIIEKAGPEARDTLIALFGSVEALNAVMSLTGKQKETFVAALKDMTNSQENLNEAFKAAQDADTTLITRQAKAAWIELADTLGQKVLPLFNEFLEDHIIPLIAEIKKWVEENEPLVESIIEWTAKTGALLVVLGPFLILLGSIVTIIPALVAGIKLVAAALMFLWANPVMLIIAAIALIVILVIKNWDKIKEYSKKAWDWLCDKFKKFTDYIAGKWDDLWGLIWDILVWIWEKILDFLGWAWDTVVAILIGGLDLLWPKWREGWLKFKNTIVNVFEGIKAYLIDFFGWLTKYFFDPLGELFQWMFRQIDRLPFINISGLTGPGAQTGPGSDAFIAGGSIPRFGPNTVTVGGQVPNSGPSNLVGFQMPGEVNVYVTVQGNVLSNDDFARDLSTRIQRIAWESMA